MSLENLKSGNNQFVDKFNENKKLYNDLVENGQHPKVLWVGCSDSRVVPEFTVNANAGDLFVTRNIANIIPPADADDNCTSSVLEYAVQHLNVEHIIICGHTDCGGINALIEGTPEGTKIHDWLNHACPVNENKKKTESDSLELETIKENILFQANNLLTFDYISIKKNNNEIKIHKWLYDIHTGKISYFDDTDKIWHQLI
jgi:carbonic anhydrase